MFTKSGSHDSHGEEWNRANRTDNRNRTVRTVRVPSLQEENVRNIDLRIPVATDLGMASILDALGGNDYLVILTQ